ncbi:MAG: anti-sigma factor antagonist [Gammaproteobacteria bacterium]|nr:MAG: anti-sigma factor antagonist [Gammaproteobacteria bacterium]
MSITSSRSDDNRTLTIRVQGRFDFSSHQEFRDAYETGGEDVAEFIIDMSETTYLDSSALGMLLLLRDYAGGDDANIRIVNCNNDVKKILTISNFEQLFSIE